MGRIKSTILNKKGGTFLYQAPEHFFIGQKWEVTLACDVWSFGLVAGELLTGQLPTGYFDFWKASLETGKRFEYPVGDQVTVFRFFLWECLKVDFLLRPTFIQLKQEFKKYKTLQDLDPRNIAIQHQSREECQAWTSSFIIHQKLHKKLIHNPLYIFPKELYTGEANEYERGFTQQLHK